MDRNTIALTLSPFFMINQLSFFPENNPIKSTMRAAPNVIYYYFNKLTSIPSLGEWEQIYILT